LSDFYGDGSIENLLNGNFCFTAHPFKHKINSSSRDYIRRGLRTSLGLLLLCCRCQNFKHFGTPHSIHHSATFILSAVPGSFDLSFDASYRAGLIIFHQNLLQNQTPFFTASTEKAKRQKM
jgi:hypothetical protein